MGSPHCMWSQKSLVLPSTVEIWGDHHRLVLGGGWGPHFPLLVCVWWDAVFSVAFGCSIVAIVYKLLSLQLMVFLVFWLESADSFGGGRTVWICTCWCFQVARSFDSTSRLREARRKAEELPHVTQAAGSLAGLLALYAFEFSFLYFWLHWVLLVAQGSSLHHAGSFVAEYRLSICSSQA